MSSPPVDLCSKCGVEESEAMRLKRCSACKGATKYCSVECQRQDWPMHREQCKEVALCIAENRAKMHTMAREERAGFATPKQWDR